MELLEAWVYHLRPSEWGGWYSYTIAALTLYGVYQYCLDVLVTRQRKSMPRSLSAVACVAASTSVVSVLCGLSLLYTVWTEDDFVPNVLEVSFLGLLQGLLFLCVNLFRFRARDVFPQHIVLPITKASILLVILSSWFLFDEFRTVTTSQLGGFILIAISIYLFREGKVGEATGNHGPAVGVPDARFKTGAFSLGMATVVSAGIALLAKYAVGPSGIDVVMFMFFSNVFSSLVGYAMVQRELQRVRGMQILSSAGSVSNPMKG